MKFLKEHECKALKRQNIITITKREIKSKYVGTGSEKIKVAFKQMK